MCYVLYVLHAFIFLILVFSASFLLDCAHSDFLQKNDKEKHSLEG